MKKYLQSLQEPVPAWLENFKAGDTPDMREVLQSRLVYYPGSGFDGQPIKTCVQSGCAHLFLYVDFCLSRKDLENNLKEHPFRGYHIVASADLEENDLCPNGWHPSVRINPKDPGIRLRNEKPYAFITVFERDEELDDTHGTRRFAVIFLFADGIATYDALFGNKNVQPPFMVVLQDHGFGGNYDSFGEGGLMDKIAKATQVFPDYAMIGAHTRPWTCFKKEEDAIPENGGMHNLPRFLYIREKN